MLCKQFNLQELKSNLDIEKIREESKRTESRLMGVIAQYEEELKKVKEELHIYQRRESYSEKFR